VALPVRQGRNLSKTFLRPSGETDPLLPFTERLPNGVT
jgi:hypothetical protein